MSTARTGLTPIAALNRQIHSLAPRRQELDAIWLKAPDGPESDAAYAAFEETLDPILRLQDEIATLPAQNLGDAAIQVVISYYRADLIGDKMTQARTERMGQELRFLQASVLLAIVKAAGLDIDQLGWGEMEGLCAAHGPQRSAAA